MSNRNLLSAVVLISGNGSNLAAIIDAIKKYSLDLMIKCVISNKTDVYGLERARKANLPTETLLRSDCESRAAYDDALAELIASYQPDLIILAGFMHILGKSFLERYPNRILNIHPSLLPKYPGLNTHAMAIEAGDFEHGCSIHFVNENVDGGPLIAQAAVAIKRKDTADSLKEKVHKAEHFLYPTVLQWFAQKRISLRDNTVLIDNIPLPLNGLKFSLLL